MSTQAKDQKKSKIITPEFRVSFPNVFQPRKKKDPKEKDKYSLCMLFRVKETPESKAAGEAVVDLLPLKQAVVDCLTDKFGVDRTKWPKGLRLPFRQGTEDGKKEMEGYGEGVEFVNVSSTIRPGLVDQKRQAIIDPSEFYAGCYARAEINAFYYEVSGNKGVSFGLNHIQKIRDGEAFSGRGKAEDVFEAIDLPGGATPAGADPLGGIGA